MGLQNNVNLQPSQRYKSTFQQLQNNVNALYFIFLEQRLRVYKITLIYSFFYVTIQHISLKYC